MAKFWPVVAIGVCTAAPKFTVEVNSVGKVNSPPNGCPSELGALTQADPLKELQTCYEALNTFSGTYQIGGKVRFDAWNGDLCATEAPDGSTYMSVENAFALLPEWLQAQHTEDTGVQLVYFKGRTTKECHIQPFVPKDQTAGNCPTTTNEATLVGKPVPLVTGSANLDLEAAAFSKSRKIALQAQDCTTAELGGGIVALQGTLAEFRWFMSKVSSGAAPRWTTLPQVLLLVALLSKLWQ
eukprot:Gregarina_sp_Pseudo_9__963@NODE_1618_length_1450_cov_24_361446_g1500_i0_p1_GENE_NODE_1618_length_1450_cov_24_361446_g1500_i0NODE_1618_length_1450_cov_24_361446_g1500_i0_p1_ORF_typecomplete_len240_score35_92_NODE_1618_length_1450_cov_24_361446_g1500_i05471266